MIEQNTVEVEGSRMAYREAGRGDPVVFLHGNPTSSYLWRNIIPQVAEVAWCVAPDLIGMGDSDKLPAGEPYNFDQNRRFLDAFYEAVGVGSGVCLVGHDWGSALAFDWAKRHRDAVRGIVYMEALVRPVTWDEWPEASRPIFQAMRSDAGEMIILEKNVFVERILPASILRDLTEDEMAQYRRPFTEPGEGRRPTLAWPRQIPIDGEPAEVAKVVAAYASWLAAADVPKLYIRSDPGFLTAISDQTCRSWPSQEEVTVRGHHFLQEDSPGEIGEAIVDWYRRL